MKRKFSTKNGNTYVVESVPGAARYSIQKVGGSNSPIKIGTQASGDDYDLSEGQPFVLRYGGRIVMTTSPVDYIVTMK